MVKNWLLMAASCHQLSQLTINPSVFQVRSFAAGEGSHVFSKLLTQMEGEDWSHCKGIQWPV